MMREKEARTILSHARLELLRQIARGLAAQFGPGCEIVIHDLTGETLEQTVVHIENGHVSGRKLGDGPSQAVLDLLSSNASPVEDHLAYLTRSADGKVLKSTTLYLRDDQGRPEALFAINYDISALLMIDSALRDLITPLETAGAEPERIPHSVSELLNQLMEQSVALVGKPVALMDREDKIKAIRFLDEKGAMLITKSGDKIAKYFGISKYTLYSYLEKEDAQ